MMIAVLALVALTASAQKFALIDMEYILKNIPAYAQANDQLDKQAKKYQAEVDAVGKDAQSLYKQYEDKSATMTDAQKKQLQDQIMKKEKEAADLKKKYFGPDGEMIKKRSELIDPIQDAVYTAVKIISQANGISLVLDRASDSGIIFGSPRIDISDEVLAKLGFSN